MDDAKQNQSMISTGQMKNTSSHATTERNKWTPVTEDDIHRLLQVQQQLQPVHTLQQDSYGLPTSHTSIVLLAS